MGLDDLHADMNAALDEFDGEVAVELDQESKHELAMLVSALDADPGELVRRAIHDLFQATVDSARLDFHLRRAYDVSYDEFLTGMTYEEMAGGGASTLPDDDRRYQF